ncbi:T-complex protein 11 homolog isoform X5 [Pelodiscus sinensis]|uniref:T-complex protein 11 homolog isoform X5 n=1 Tax=Pelodiscus sinensis TaxID=13735 RepID=UPI003F6DA19A
MSNPGEETPDPETAPCRPRQARPAPESRDGDVPSLRPPQLPARLLSARPARSSTQLSARAASRPAGFRRHTFHGKASPPPLLSVAELLETAQEISKMTIAHEIVLNRDFKVQEVNLSPNREIFRVLDLMKMDMANFTIQSLRPHLQDHAIHYEQKKFQELLAKLPNSLDHTTEWLSKAAAEVSASSSSHPEDHGSPTALSLGAVSRSSATPNPMSVLNQGYMNLLHWEPGTEKYPETLLMDQARLQEIQLQVNQLTIIAAVLLVSSSVCGSTLFSSPVFVDRLKRVTKALLEGLPCTRFQEALLDISNHVHREVSEALLQLDYPAFTSEKSSSLKGQIRSIAEKDNAVRSIIEQRIHSFLSLHLSSTAQNSHNLPKGLAPVQEELLEVGHRFSSVIHHNRQVYGPYYLAILKEVLLPGAEAEAGIGSF